MGLNDCDDRRRVRLLSTLALTVVALVHSATADAALRYTFTTTITDNRTDTRSGTVLVDDEAARLDYDSSQAAFRSVIVRDGRRIALNPELRTWYELKEWPSQSRLFTVQFAERSSLQNLIVRLGQPAAAADGGEVRTLSVSYRLVGAVQRSKIGARVRATAVVVTDPDRPVPELPLDPRLIRTGIAEVDTEIARHMSEVKGFPREVVLTVKRQVDGGAAFSETEVTRISDVRESEADPAVFKVPADYDHREPVYGVPGAQ